MCDGIRSRLSLQRSSHPMGAIICGLDVHKELTYVTILSQDGEAVAHTKNAQRGGPSLPQTPSRREGSHGGLHQHRAPMQEASRRGLPGHRLPPPQDPIHCRGPHQVRLGRLQSPGGAAEAEQPPRELHSAQDHRGAPGEGAPQGLPGQAADQAEGQDQGCTRLRGRQAPGGARLYTLKGREWLEGLGLESICCHLRVMTTRGEEIRRLNLELRHITAGG